LVEMAARPRHIAYVLKRWPRISETFIAAELIELQRQGEMVTVFAISRPDEALEHGLVAEMTFPVIYLPYRPLRHPVRVASALARCLRRHPRAWLDAARRSVWPFRMKGLRRLLQASVLRVEMADLGIDHVHAHFATAAARLANLAWRMEGPAYSVTAHAKDIYHEEVQVEHLTDKLCNATFVATVTEANRAYLESVLTASVPLEVIPNAVDLPRLLNAASPPRRNDTVLAVARLIEKKGLEDLVQACGILQGRGVPAQLEIVGEGPLREELDGAAGRLGVRARFFGSLAHEEVLPLYRRARVFCLPCVVASTGDRDGLPTSLLEAMALGTPVVTTALPGLTEAVTDEQTGLVVAQRDPEALAKALERLLTDDELCARLADHARKRVASCFSVERSVAMLRSLWPEAH
jgi:colanic acid/amylovoran biosynthesis glycosyltransferase